MSEYLPLPDVEEQSLPYETVRDLCMRMNFWRLERHLPDGGHEDIKSTNWTFVRFCAGNPRRDSRQRLNYYGESLVLGVILDAGEPAQDKVRRCPPVKPAKVVATTQGKPARHRRGARKTRRS
ncbi:MAG: hypothetical protein WAT39_16270 [Planctomycetota bacterium]